MAQESSKAAPPTAGTFTQPKIHIKFSATSDTYHRSVAEEKDLIQLRVETLLDHPRPITLDLRGQFASDTVLEETFYFQHFEWFDLTTQQVLQPPEFTNHCDPGGTLEPRQCLTLEPFKPLVTMQFFDEMSPLCDPLRAAKVGHQYRLRLKPQGVWWCEGTTEELFREHKVLKTDELPRVTPVRLESDHEVKILVEE